MAQFEMLFSPLQVRNKTVKNRIMASGHLTHFATPDGYPTDRMINYHEARAKGGLGMMVTESMSVWPTSAQSPFVVHLYEDKVIPKLTELTRAVKQYGCVIINQMHHMGREMWSEDTRREIVAPSPIIDPAKCLVPHELTTREVKQYVQHHIDAAKRCLASGYDGVEVHIAHGYLIHEFTSPLFNKRSDEYGGSFENRIRFAKEIIEGCRALSNDWIVGTRMTGDDMHEDGYSMEDYQNVAVKLESFGLDYIGLSLGHNVGQTPATFPNMDFPFGFATYLASGVKRLVNVPVYTSHRINDPALAEQVLQDGHADLIVMTRATLADPELPNKAKEGRIDDIRPCIACLQGCFQRLKNRTPGISCFGNAAAGEEKEFEIKPAEKVKKVAVIGGGPAGMEAARVLKERGHQVTLFEKNDELGGMLIRGANEVPGRVELFGVCRWQIIQLDKLGVDVRLGKEATVDDIKNGGFDACIVATGAYYGEPTVQYGSVPHYNVYQALDLTDAEVEGKKVLIIEKETFNKGIEIAEKFAEMGAESVAVITDKNFVGQDIPYINRVMTLDRIAANEYDVKLLGSCHVADVDGNNFTLNYGGGWEREIEVDFVVVVDYLIADNKLSLEIEAAMPDLEMHLVGNCLAPRQTQDLIHDGYRVALLV